MCIFCTQKAYIITSRDVGYDQNGGHAHSGKPIYHNTSQGCSDLCWCASMSLLPGQKLVKDKLRNVMITAVKRHLVEFSRGPNCVILADCHWSCCKCLNILRKSHNHKSLGIQLPENIWFSDPRDIWGIQTQSQWAA